MRFIVPFSLLIGMLLSMWAFIGARANNKVELSLEYQRGYAAGVAEMKPPFDSMRRSFEKANSAYQQMSAVNERNYKNLTSCIELLKGANQ